MNLPMQKNPPTILSILKGAATNMLQGFGMEYIWTKAQETTK